MQAYVGFSYGNGYGTLFVPLKATKNGGYRFLESGNQIRLRSDGSNGSGNYFHSFGEMSTDIKLTENGWIVSGWLWTDVGIGSVNTGCLVHPNGADRVGMSSAYYWGKQYPDVMVHFDYYEVRGYSIYWMSDIWQWKDTSSSFPQTNEAKQEYLKYAIREIRLKGYLVRSSKTNMMLVSDMRTLTEKKRCQLPQAGIEGLHFDKDELTIWEQIKTTGSPWNNNIKMGLASAYLDATNKIPDSTVNTLANVIDAVGSIKGLLSGDLGKVKHINDAWLAWRYAYCTTKSDVCAYAELTTRLVELRNLPKIRCHGQYQDESWRYRASFDVNTSSILPSSTLDTLSLYCGKLSAVTAWDLIPYSFIVDWFLHISEILEYFENSAQSLSINVDNAWSSMEDDRTYIRMSGVEKSMPAHIKLRQAREKTIFMRIADSIALFGPR